MEIRKAGRPKKINAIKPGQLKKGERRFTFITSLENVTEIKRRAKEDKIKIKDYLNQVLQYYWNKKKPKNKHETELELYLKNKKIQSRKIKFI